MVADAVGRDGQRTGLGRIRIELPGGQRVAVFEHEVPVLAAACSVV